MPDFLVPDLGEGLTEVTVARWTIRIGDEVVVDQIVVEVETAKSLVEVPSPFAGTVSALYAKEGETLEVGRPLLSVTSIEELTGEFSESVIVTRHRASDTTVDATGPSDEMEESGSLLVGSGTSRSSGNRRRRRGSSEAGPRMPDRKGVLPDPIEALAPPADLQATPVPNAGVISPVVRKLARDEGIDISSLTGSGPAGLVMRRDIEQVLTGQSHCNGSTALLGPNGSTAAGADPSGDEQRIPLTGTRKAIADKLSRSRREIPEATVWVDIDATDFLAARAAINSRSADPVGVLALVAKFAILGLKRFPELNGRVEPDEIVLSPSIHLGFAAQTDRGLVVPVVHNADLMSTRELSAAIGALTEKARGGSVGPQDLRGGTFTINNYGVFGVDGSAAIINHPEVGILGLGRIIERPWVVEGTLAIRKVTQLTLAFDHRVCDGGTAGGFLRFVADCIESPVVALAEL